MMSEGSSETCMECGGMCCSFRDMHISLSQLEDGERYDSHFLDQSDEAIESLLFKDGEVPEMDWYIIEDLDGNRAIAHDCTHRTEDGLCGEYERRPGLCREFQCQAIHPDSDVTLEEFKEQMGFPDGRPDSHIVKEVTERVREILQRRAEAMQE